MEAISPQRLAIIMLIIFFTLSLANAKWSQSSHLNKLQKAKFHGNGSIRRSLSDFLVRTKSIKHKHQHRHHHHPHHHMKAMRENDRIHALPGQPKVNFSQYGGYVTIDNKGGSAFYYYFAEADHPNKESLPLLLWLNGGPGCSSLAYGAMQELGPFRVNSDGKSLYRNRYAWNKAANVLFLESPAGVGFSYSNRTSDYKLIGDTETAEDNYVFLLNWLERFPEYKKRDFFISGESYAGHYIPELAHAILQHNADAKPDSKINLKGIIMGNAVINDETDTKGMYEYFWTHALISDQTRNTIMKQCDFSPNASSQTEACLSAAETADAETNYLDIYNIYAPICHDSNLTSKPKMPTQVMDPCSDYYIHAYLNTPEVQKALHANVTKLPYDWEPCSDVIRKWGDSPTTMIPLLKSFIAQGIRVWVFSGDVDGRVPVTSTRESLNVMGLPIKTKWHPWFIKGEIGGYTQEYEGNLTFATVRGAGHEVPSYQPVRALSMIIHFLEGTPLPNTSLLSRN